MRRRRSASSVWSATLTLSRGTQAATASWRESGRKAGRRIAAITASVSSIAMKPMMLATDKPSALPVERIARDGTAECPRSRREIVV